MANLLDELKQKQAQPQSVSVDLIAEMNQLQTPGINQDMVGQFKGLLMRQARGEQGLDEQIATLQEQLSTQQAQRPEREMPQPETVDQIPFVVDLFTGANRTTPELEDLPRIGAAPELSEMFMRASSRARPTLSGSGWLP